ncbi:MAG: ABC transporter permease subunit [Patescibacteria group bacterium]|nr:ABC transporter permease subunit [Patescibacteria group bacterium]
MKARFTHYTHRGHRVHRLSFLEKVLIWLIVPALVIVIAMAAITFVGVRIVPIPFAHLPIGYLGLAFLSSFARLFVAYIASLVVGLLLALAVIKSALWERVLIPVYDVLESVPVLVFFPVIILFFIHYGWLNSAAIFILFLTMIWSIVFNAIGALRVIPADILAVPKIFKLGRFTAFRKVILPALFPSLVTGSLLAWAAGWNILIVAEVLHTYVPAGENVADVFGIGSILVQASATGNQSIFLWSIVIIVVAIMIINIFVWQKLLRYAERYKFD